jgi:manganese/zinc/iron transport system permease protein
MQLPVWTSLDSWIVLSALLVALNCALLGNFLLLRKQSMMGDAISHAVLPGLAAAFLLTGSRGSLVMFVGALVLGVVTAFLVQWITKTGQVEEGASMGVVFTSLFALGLILIRQAASQVDLDPSCVLYGAVELAPFDVVKIGGWSLPNAVLVNGAMLLVNGVFVMVLWKELKLSSFDSALAKSLGMRVGALHYGFMALVAATTVASFQVVGSILVIAMLIVPAATAFLLTRRLWVMVFLSLLVAAGASIGGHWSALVVPELLGYEGDTSTAGMIAVFSGLLFLCAWLFSPQQGVVALGLHRLREWERVAKDDVLAALWRLQEKHHGPVAFSLLKPILSMEPVIHRFAFLLLRIRGRIKLDRGDLGERTVQLIGKGYAEAQKVVRSHRLWEHYLVEEIGVRVDRVHQSAERLEHVTSQEMRAEMARELGNPEKDPHLKTIPGEETV